jgi:LacI family transcriptional regulator
MTDRLNEQSSTEQSPLTIDDVAEAAGVSRSTVSLVLRNSSLVAASTGEKVRETINRLGYVYNRKAAIRARFSYLIGIVIPDLANPFFSELTAGIDEVLNEAGWVSLVGNSWESVSKQTLILQRMQEHKVDAVVVCPAVDSPGGLTLSMAKAGLRTLQVLRRVDGEDNYLGIDYAHGVSLAVEHLWELGHRDIVFLGGERHHSAAIERHTGYEASMRAHKLRPRYVQCPLTRQAAADAIGKLFGDDKPPTALVCFNDVVAMGAISGLERVGLHAGRDVSVVGFDNVAEASFINPRLTTVDSNARGLGATAAQLILESIRSGEPVTGAVAMQTTLAVRESSGPVKAASSKTARPTRPKRS